jgi:glycosyltransferase involved in cell wall biosynthesis
MLRLAGDAALRRDLGSAARRTARAKFSLTTMLKRYEEIYLDALGLRNPSPAR